MWRQALCAFAFCAVFVSRALAGPLTYLDPLSISPGALYTDTAYPDVGNTFFYSNCTSIEVMPPFQPDGVTPYSTIGSGIIGGVDSGTNLGSVTFNVAGPYSYRVTYTDTHQEYFYSGTDFNDQPENPPPAPKPYKKIPTPAPDIVIVDSNPYTDSDGKTQNLKDSQPVFGPGTTKVEKTSWADVIGYLKNLPANANKHVELSGHGSPGELFWNGVSVLNKQNLSTVLQSLVGKVNNLTFMACNVGQNSTFLQNVANLLGASAGYTKSVGGNGTDWFIWDNGSLVEKVRVPEPGSCLMIVGVTLFASRRHRRAA